MVPTRVPNQVETPQKLPFILVKEIPGDGERIVRISPGLRVRLSLVLNKRALNPDGDPWPGQLYRSRTVLHPTARCTPSIVDWIDRYRVMPCNAEAERGGQNGKKERKGKTETRNHRTIPGAR